MTVGGGLSHLTRELLRAVASVRQCDRAFAVALRRREFVFSGLGYAHAISYQDADLHNGNIPL